jgi:formate hydrogenlyase subunit 3/multisubunit Na+/H+ antiporter MnhD subunit
MDGLSAVFVIPILLVSALAAVFGSDYLKGIQGSRRLGWSWFLYLVLVVSMYGLVLARNAMLFLLMWEIMSLSSFFLVLFEGHRDNVRQAGWTYLVATHVGAAFLLVMFLILGHSCGGSMEFSAFVRQGGSLSALVSGVVFLLAVAGFGTKAGFIPLHVWLPEAHPAAPSHVSAVMSGVMIKTGLYGLLRVLGFLGDVSAWWGWVLVLIGAVSGVLGVLFALAQQDLKRLLAYSSVENIGIMAMGFGMGLLGWSAGNATVAILGVAGALLHILNHAMFKSLLFLSAGSVLHATGVRDMDQLGGLLKRMPVTGASFLAGALAVCGLPPFNGFVGEFLIYSAAFVAIVQCHGLVPAAGLVTAASLALIGGLAVACFTQAFGVVFQGEPRSEHGAHAHEGGMAMRVPMGVLATLCLMLGVAGPLAMGAVWPAVQKILPASLLAGAAIPPAILVALAWVSGGALALLILVLGLFAVRVRVLRGREVREAVTWDCGYVAPTARMQYTSSSFAQPVTALFRVLLGTRQSWAPPQGLFPSRSLFASETPDFYRERFYAPIFLLADRLFAQCRWIQHGRLNLYILCMVLALLGLLFWKLG